MPTPRQPNSALFSAKLCLALGAAALVAGTTGCGGRAAAGPRADATRGQELRAAVGAGSASSSGGEAEASAAPTGWATLSGTFTLAGAAPKPAAIDVNKDQEVCGKHPLHDESLEVGPKGGVQNVVVWVRTPKLPVNPDVKLEPRDVVLDNKGCRFEPHVLVMNTKEKLLIKNSDPVSHNSKGDAIVNSSFNAIIPAGNSSEFDLAKEESLPIRVGCNIHPWMGAWVVVRNDPYAAVSDASGNFSIANLPAGRDLEFQIWQEKVGGLKEVEVNGVKVDGKGRFKLKLADGEDKKLEFKVLLK